MHLQPPGTAAVLLLISTIWIWLIFGLKSMHKSWKVGVGGLEIFWTSTWTLGSVQKNCWTGFYRFVNRTLATLALDHWGQDQWRLAGEVVWYCWEWKSWAKPDVQRRPKGEGEVEVVMRTHGYAIWVSLLDKNTWYLEEPNCFVFVCDHNKIIFLASWK